MRQETSLNLRDCQTSSWEGHTWSDWHSLGAATYPRTSTAPDASGWYRIRCRGEAGLIYIGETGVSLRSRFRQLQKAMEYAAAGKYTALGKVGGPPHVAGGCVLKHERAGNVIEVSWATSSNPDSRERRGIECELIAAYRKLARANPACQFSGDLAEDGTD